MTGTPQDPTPLQADPELPTTFRGHVPATSEVSFGGVRVILAGFGVFADLASQLLRAEGIDLDTEAAWLPTSQYLQVLQRVRAQIDDAVLRQIGFKMPATFPIQPPPQTAHEALAGIDTAYRSAHRGGDVGCYHYRFVSTQRADIVALNPYPCPLDEALISAFARVVEPRVTVTHDPVSCRDRGDPACLYHVSW